MLTEINFHPDESRPNITVQANNSRKTYWVSITIGTLCLTVFTPSLGGTEYILNELKKGYMTEIADEPLPEFTQLEVEITAYNADPAQTDSTPTITASGERVSEKYCALSRDIEKEHRLEFGDIIHITGYGEFEFQDRMNKRIKKGVDIFRWDRQEALEIGRQKGSISFAKK